VNERPSIIPRISDWMRFWAPEIQKRIQRNDAESPVFVAARDAYKAVCDNPMDLAMAEDCWAKFMAAIEILDKAPPGAFDYLAHIGEYIV